MASKSHRTLEVQDTLMTTDCHLLSTGVRDGLRVYALFKVMQTVVNWARASSQLWAPVWQTSDVWRSFEHTGERNCGPLKFQKIKCTQEKKYVRMQAIELHSFIFPSLKIIPAVNWGMTKWLALTSLELSSSSQDSQEVNNTILFL